MDPLAHTLVGATLAETGLKRRTALGTATLIIAANLPDIDGITILMGRDSAILHRRGWTHGILAMTVLPLLLAALMLVVDRSRAKSPDRQPVRFLWLVLLACVGVWSHPFLDWCNQYGVRLLMPFSGDWFYGDALFIVDPWLWLLAACPVMLANSRGKPARTAWLILLVAATAFVTQSELTPPEAKIIWCIGGGLIVFLRVRERPPGARVTALVCVAVMAIYVATMLAGTVRAGSRARAWLETRGMTPTRIVALPLAARSFEREVIALVDGRYHFLRVRWLGDGAISIGQAPIPVGNRDAVVEAALVAPSIRGFAHWVRLPTFRTEKLADGFRVTIGDVRYSRSRPAFGTVTVELDANLKERSKTGD